MVDKCEIIPAADDKSMPKHKLPLKEYHVNEKIKTRWCTTLPETKYPAGKSPKIILMVGAIGAGKSTLIDTFVNYVLGVAWDDPFRFTIIDVKDDEKRNARQQTEWITTYVIHPYPGSRITDEIRIIDMPGFGEDLQKDGELVDRLRTFFTLDSVEGGHVELHQVCLVVQAAQPCPTQALYCIESLFDKSIKDKISIFITFADGNPPSPVLAALKKANAFVYGIHYAFNNFALFAVTKGDKTCSDMAKAKVFWDMGQNNCVKVFEALMKMQTKSFFRLSSKVLHKRNQLEIHIQTLRRMVTKRLAGLDTLVQQRQMLDMNELKVQCNKNFKYTVNETKYSRTEITDETCATNCRRCNETCHYPCRITNDIDKNRCGAMENGKCTACKNKCVWQEHTSDGHRYELKVLQIEKTNEGMKQKYEEALQGTSELKDVIEALSKDSATLQKEIHEVRKDITEHTNWLKQYALSDRPPSTIIDHYETMIESEEREKKPGYQKRTKMLKDALENCRLLLEVRSDMSNPLKRYMDQPELLDHQLLYEMADNHFIAINSDDK